MTTASHWGDPLPRFVVNRRGSRIRCICTERDLCLMHAWQKQEEA